MDMITKADLQELLKNVFAHWIQELRLEVRAINNEKFEFYGLKY